MLNKNDPMLLLDRRFLMDFLTEDAPAEKEILIRPAIAEIPTRDDVLRHADKVGGYAHRVRRIFLKASEAVLPIATVKEFDQWALMGLSLLQKFSQYPMMAGRFFQTGCEVLQTCSFSCLKGWAETGEMIGRHSPRAAAAFFRLTPLFLEHGDIFRIRKWGEMAVRIMSQGHGQEEMAISFFKNSIHCMRFMPLREIKDWQSLGVLFAGHSPELGQAFFSTIPAAWENLNGEDRSRLYRAASVQIRTDARNALCFFMDAPGHLRDVGPNVRELMIDVAEKLSKQQPGEIAVVINRLTSAVKGFSNPVQEMVLRQGNSLAGLSLEAAGQFIDHAREVLLLLPEAFLSCFVDQGASLISSDPLRAGDYFSLTGDEAQQEILKWKHALLLDDYRGILVMFARAMTGKTMKIQSIQPSEARPDPFAVMDFMASQPTVCLPSFVAGGKTVKENFSVYKAATARQAGRLEFNGAEGLGTILKIIRSFALKELAAKIFFILEDGRMDRVLKQHYRGLEKDIETAVSHALHLRSHPVFLPLWEALVEILERLVADRWNPEDEEALSGSFMVHIEFLKNSLSGFYKDGMTIWDCFSKMIDIYRYIVLVLNSCPEGVSERIGGAGSKFEASPDHGSGSACFQNTIETQTPKTPLEIDVKQIKASEGSGGRPLSLEELQQLIGQQDEPWELLKMIDGKILSGPGVFIQNQDQLVLKAPARQMESSAVIPPAPRVDLKGGHILFSGPFYYDEWDYEQQAYRKKWCRLTEKTVEGVCPDRVHQIFSEIHAAHKGLIQEVKKQFERIRPNLHEILPRVEWGDEIDVSAAIQVVADKKSGIEPSDRIFTRKEKKIRKIAVVFLVDMSASTGNQASVTTPSSGKLPDRSREACLNEKKIIDIEIESLLVIAEALEALNDEYAIYGFSGYGRDNVDFYTIKDFRDSYSDQLKGRIAGIRPRQSTRMGPAIRHASRKLASMETQQRLLILLSDGFPQDCDYGEDRTSYEYGLQDTMMALLEAKNQEIYPFCITVDQSGSDYLKRICDPRNYLVIKDIFSLPRVLPKVVESLLE